jgi:hypothetical protein
MNEQNAAHALAADSPPLKFLNYNNYNDND